MSPKIPPNKLLDFIELRPFTRRWRDLGLDDESDLAALQFTILDDPVSGAVMQGTDGIRKLRFSPPSWNLGKSGATRVLYVYFAEYRIVLLCLIYAKGESADISEAGKKHLNQLIAEIAIVLRDRKKRRNR